MPARISASPAAPAVPVIGVEFGYTEVPIADLKPDRLIGHMRELPGAVESLMLLGTPSKALTRFRYSVGLPSSTLTIN